MRMHDLSTVLGLPALSPQAPPSVPLWPPPPSRRGVSDASMGGIAEQVQAVGAEAQVLAERMDALAELLQRSPAARSRAS